MNLTQRERYIAIGLGALLGLFALFQFVIKPYFDRRSAVFDGVEAAGRIHQQNSFVLAEQSKLRVEYKKMIADGLSNQAADSQQDIRHALDVWSRASGISVKKLDDEQSTHQGDFEQINFSLSGDGTTKNIAKLLNQCETTRLPLRLGKFEPKPKKEGQDDLSFDLTVSTICRSADDTLDRGMVSDVGSTPVTAQDLKPLDPPYQILLTRSIFASDNRAAPDPVPAMAVRRPTAIQPTTTASVLPPAPEADYVLRGVGIQDGLFTAFFEQTSVSKGVSRHSGETIAGGRIASMSLDGIDYALFGKTTHIAIGQALDGRMTIATGSTATSTPSTTGGGEKPSWWGHHSHRDEPAPTAATAPAPGAPPGPTTNPTDPNQKPGDAPPGPPGPPDDDSDPIIIIAPR